MTGDPRLDALLAIISVAAVGLGVALERAGKVDVAAKVREWTGGNAKAQWVTGNNLPTARDIAAIQEALASKAFADAQAAFQQGTAADLAQGLSFAYPSPGTQEQWGGDERGMENYGTQVTVNNATATLISELATKGPIDRCKWLRQRKDDVQNNRAPVERHTYSDSGGVPQPDMAVLVNPEYPASIAGGLDWFLEPPAYLRAINYLLAFFGCNGPGPTPSAG